jgi:glutaminyl-peptide cyclotransferase
VRRARRQHRRAARLAPALALAGGALLGLAAALGSAAPGFDGRAAFRHVERLVAFGPRPAGSPEAARARRYIVDELKKVGAQVRVDAFEADTPHGRLPMANVIAVLPGRRSDIVLVGGHYDTKWFADIRFVGANDGGSSAGLLLELTRALAARPRGFTYWVVFFDGEEARLTWTERDSLYGSRRLASAMARDGTLPRAVVVADMIGDRDLAIRPEASSTPWLTDLVWQAAARLGHGAHFRFEPLAVEDDHAPFLRLGVPATLLIDFDYPPWHTAEDTLDKVSARSLQVVGEVLLEALADLERRLEPR